MAIQYLGRLFGTRFFGDFFGEDDGTGGGGGTAAHFGPQFFGSLYFGRYFGPAGGGSAAEEEIAGIAAVRNQARYRRRFYGRTCFG